MLNDNDIIVPVTKQTVSTKPSIDNYSIDDLLGEIDIDVTAVKNFNIVEKIDDESTVEVEVELYENPISEFDSEPETVVNNESGAMATTEEDIISAITTAEDNIIGEDIIDDTTEEKVADVEEPIVEQKKPTVVKKSIPKKSPIADKPVEQTTPQPKKTVAKKQPVVKVQESVVIESVIVSEDAKPLPFDNFDNAVTKIETPQPKQPTFKEDMDKLRSEAVTMAHSIIPADTIAMHTVVDMIELVKEPEKKEEPEAIEDQDDGIRPKGLKKLERMNIDSFEYIVKSNLMHIGFDIDKNDVSVLIGAVVTSCDEFVKKTSLRELLKTLLK